MLIIGSLSSSKHLIADILHKQHDFVILEYKDFKKKDNVAKECLSQAKKTWPKTVVIIGIDSLEKFVQLDDYLQFGVKPSEQDFEKILENLHLDSEEMSPLNKCMDA